MVSDEMLVESAQMGNHRAFELLMQRHQGFVRRSLNRFRCFQSHEIDDACQEVFIKVFLALKNFRAQARFTTWVYRILMNYALEKMRAKDLPYSAFEDCDWVDVGNHTEQEDLRRDIRLAMDKITRQQQQVICLCLLEGYSHMEISKQESLPLGTVKTHALRGRTRLQEVLKDWSPKHNTEGVYCAVE